MYCVKHGWDSDAECISCLDEARIETVLRERFEMNAVIYFYDNRTYPGISPDVAESLRERCWADARALYVTGQKLPLKVSVDTNVATRQDCSCEYPEYCSHPNCPGRPLASSERDDRS